jgi:hypothetical protein
MEALTTPFRNQLQCEHQRGQKEVEFRAGGRVRNEANPINRQRWGAEPAGRQGQQSVVRREAPQEQRWEQGCPATPARNSHCKLARHTVR